MNFCELYFGTRDNRFWSSFWKSFRHHLFSRSQKVERVLSKMLLVTCVVELCLSWATPGAKITVVSPGSCNCFVSEGVKSYDTHPSLRCFWDLVRPSQYHPPIICKLPFFFKKKKGRLLRFKHEEAEEEADYIDPFQSGFRNERRPEIILVTLVDDLNRHLDWGMVPSGSFRPLGSLWHRQPSNYSGPFCKSWELEALFYNSPLSSIVVVVGREELASCSFSGEVPHGLVVFFLLVNS